MTAVELVLDCTANVFGISSANAGNFILHLSLIYLILKNGLLQNSVQDKCT